MIEFLAMHRPISVLVIISQLVWTECQANYLLTDIEVATVNLLFC